MVELSDRIQEFHGQVSIRSSQLSLAVTVENSFKVLHKRENFVAETLRDA